MHWEGVVWVKPATTYKLLAQNQYYRHIDPISLKYAEENMYIHREMHPSPNVHTCTHTHTHTAHTHIHTSTYMYLCIDFCVNVLKDHTSTQEHSYYKSLIDTAKAVLKQTFTIDGELSLMHDWPLEHTISLQLQHGTTMNRNCFITYQLFDHRSIIHQTRSSQDLFTFWHHKNVGSLVSAVKWYHVRWRTVHTKI